MYINFALHASGKVMLMKAYVAIYLLVFKELQKPILDRPTELVITGAVCSIRSFARKVSAHERYPLEV